MGVTVVNSHGWPEGSAEAAIQLHRLLTIQERDWHALKSQADRRGAEQLAAALVQLLSAGRGGGDNREQARRNAIELAEHSLGWLRRERKDPGCPQHGR
ncbi:hypothetical protein KBZ13_06655 [Cyanobium sp. ATX 6F1]|nr:hypothetical protein [Cyanobium sp. ATX 6F1]